MPRAIWSGAVSFGLVNIPVKLFNAVSRKSVSFNQIDRRTGSRIRYKKVSAADGEEVPNEEIVKGYELGSGEFVLIDDEELATLDPEATRSVDIEEFVELADIDPIFYDAAYYLAPEKGAAKPYKLLAEAMEESGKVALARFVMRTKQYLAAIRAADGRLVLSTMVYHDEVNDPAELPEFDELDAVDVSERERAMAEQLIESLTASFKPEQYHDTHREQVLELIDRKAAGEEVVAAPAAPTAEKVVDLMAALEASVSAAKEARKRHPAAGRSDAKAKAAKAEEAEDADEAEEAKAPPKRAAGRKRKSA